MWTRLRAWWDSLEQITVTIRWPKADEPDWTAESMGPMR